jgi:hypothetical protein
MHAATTSAGKALVSTALGVVGNGESALPTHVKRRAAKPKPTKRRAYFLISQLIQKRGTSATGSLAAGPLLLPAVLGKGVTNWVESGH